jgi:hypothetical protein
VRFSYVGDGLNRWTAVSWLDAAHLYQACLERRLLRGLGFTELLKRLRSEILLESENA